MNNYEANVEQLELLGVKESNEKRVPAKRVDIVSLRLVKETSLLNENRVIRSPEDGKYPGATHSYNSDMILTTEYDTKEDKPFNRAIGRRAFFCIPNTPCTKQLLIAPTFWRTNIKMCVNLVTLLTLTSRERIKLFDSIILILWGYVKMKVIKIPYDVPESDREILKVHFNDYHYSSSDPEYVEDAEIIGENYWGRIFEEGNGSQMNNHLGNRGNSKKCKGYVLQNARDSSISKVLKSLYNHTCQCCHNKHQTGPHKSGVETHHLHPIGGDGPDCKENMIVVCPNCHSFLDAGSLKIDLETYTITHFDSTHKLNGQRLKIKHQLNPDSIKIQNAKYIRS